MDTVFGLCDICDEFAAVKPRREAADGMLIYVCEADKEADWL
jgi:hypothetical protein